MCDPSPMAKPGTSKDCIEDNLSRSDVSVKDIFDAILIVYKNNVIKLQVQVKNLKKHLVLKKQKLTYYLQSFFSNL